MIQCNEINEVKKVNFIKNFKFYLDSVADVHICYDKFLFNDDIESLTKFKSIEVITEQYASVIDIKSIIFDLNVYEKHVKNIIIEVEYVSEAHFNLIFIDMLCRKNCRAEHND